MPTPVFTARSYYNASREHLALALRLQEVGQHFASHYFAGIATECILRSLSVRVNDSFDSCHSLEYSARKANLLPQGTEEQQDEFRAKVAEINLRWRANQRYYTAKMLDTYLHSTNVDGKVRGDKVKVSCERILSIANDVVFLGEILWNKR